MCHPQQDQSPTNSGSETSAWYWQMTLLSSRSVCVFFFDSPVPRGVLSFFFLASQNSADKALTKNLYE